MEREKREERKYCREKKILGFFLFPTLTIRPCGCKQFWLGRGKFSRENYYSFSRRKGMFDIKGFNKFSTQRG